MHSRFYALALAIVAVLAGVGRANAADATTLKRTLASYDAAIARIAHTTGNDTAFDYAQRLMDDIESLNNPTGPLPGYDAAARSSMLENISTLDVSLAQQLLDGRYRTLGDIRGLGETLLRSSADGTMQPVAVYVPSSYVPSKRTPLVVFLHGRPQSETQLLSKPDITAIANETGSIVIAPYGRAYYNFRGSALADVYDAVDAARHAFNIDPRRRYLAGYSMGGFSIFEVAPKHAADWTAIMCISGGLLETDALAVLQTLHPVPLYVLTGSNDASIPTEFTTESAGYLRYTGEPVSFYSQPGGQHYLETLRPILERAWNDMLGGIVREPPPNFAGTAAPPQLPMGLKP
jgi:dienelactone hydrolase